MNYKRDSKGRFVKGTESYNSQFRKKMKCKYCKKYFITPNWTNNKYCCRECFIKDGIGKWNEGLKRSEGTKIKISSFRKNRTYEQLFGEKKAKKIKNKIAESFIGALNHQWRGGLSFEPYLPDFNINLKEFIRKKYYLKCQLCCKNQNKFKRKLSIHHIDYNKKNNNEENLIPLCEKCHSKTNYNRKYWTKFFKERIL